VTAPDAAPSSDGQQLAHQLVHSGPGVSVHQPRVVQALLPVKLVGILERRLVEGHTLMKSKRLSS
jgi:hypothetical protein